MNFWIFSPPAKRLQNTTRTISNQNLRTCKVALQRHSPEPEAVVLLCHIGAHTCATKMRCGKSPGITAAAIAQEANHRSPKCVVVQNSSSLIRHLALPPTTTPAALPGVPTVGETAQPVVVTPTAQGLGGNRRDNRSSRDSSIRKTGTSSCGLSSKSCSNSRVC